MRECKVLEEHVSRETLLQPSLKNLICHSFIYHLPYFNVYPSPSLDYKVVEDMNLIFFFILKT